MNYLIILDLDGTLLNSKNEISDYTKRILSDCQRKNNKIVISTSRSYKRTISYANEINADYILSFDGNFICDKKYNIIYHNSFSRIISKEIINFLKINNYDIISENLYSSFCTNLSDINLIEGSSITIYKALKSYDNYKFLVRGDYKDFEFIKNNLGVFASISYDNTNKLIRILPSNTDKWNGIEKILKKQKHEYKTIVFGDDVSDLNSLKNANIGIRMKNSSEQVKNDIKFSTYSNDEDGVATFLCNYFNLVHKQVNYENIKILDCSLRDGGHLNKCMFGERTINSFIDKLLKTGIDIIEIGFLEDCEYSCDVTKFPNVSYAEKLLEKHNENNSIFSLLLQVDKFNINNLEKCCGKVKMIRVSFHKNLIDDGIRCCKKVKELGYICSVNPINFSSYDNEEVVNLIRKVNEINPDVFSIVDTFGMFLNKDFKNKLSLLNHLLNKDIKIGIHLHNNLYQPFSSAQLLIEDNTFKENIIIDTSVNGIGRSPGNLKTEIMTHYINDLMGRRKYKIENIYSIMENEIIKLKKHLNWENDFAYSMTAFRRMHRTYAEYLLDKNLSYLEIERILNMIPENEKGRFNEKIIKKCYEKCIKGGNVKCI